MRKGLWIIISICLCFALVSCGKSEAAENVDNLILGIGEITLDSKEKIEEVEEAVESLEKVDYDQLEHLSKLEDAKDEYISLKADEIEALIDAIKAGNRKNTSPIKKARGKYNSADPIIQERVENYAKLVEFENELSDLKVRELMDAIDQIGDVSFEKRTTIRKIQEEYNSLKKEEKERIENYNILEDAGNQLTDIIYKSVEEDYQRKEKETKEILSSFTERIDEVEGKSWYMPSAFPKYTDSRSYILPYIGKVDTSVWLRLRILYTGDTWVFFDNVTISVDGNNYYKSFNYNDVHRDNDTEVWEYVDLNPTPEDMQMLREIADSEKTIVRFQGDERQYDLTVSAGDKAAIKEVLDAYDALKK